MEYHCYNCNAELQLPGGKAARGDSCFKCRADIRVCKNCLHYDTNAYNECHESQAERVVDKTKANFCDFFSMRSGTAAKATNNTKKDQLGKLDDLFKK